MWQMPGHLRLGIVPNRKVNMDNTKIHEMQNRHNEKVVNVIQSIGSNMRQLSSHVEKHRNCLLAILGIQAVTIIVLAFEVMK